MGNNLRNDRKKKFVFGILAVLIIGMLIVGGYVLFSDGNGGGNGEDGQNGGEGSESINSIDFYMQGFQKGEISGNLRYRVEDIGTETPKIRIDKVGAEEILIFNYDENAEYAYTGTSWMKFSISQNDPYSGIPFEEWAQEGPGDYEFTYQDFRVEVTIERVNPSLQDNIFTPPENATVKEFDTA